MSISQRISRQTKQRLDEIQAKFVLERVNVQKISLPDLIDQMTVFIEDHIDQFKEYLADRSKNQGSDARPVPDFLTMTVETEATGSPDDYREYDFDDL